MKVTVCELHDEPGAFQSDWERLISHVKTESSHIVLLPEMPFYRWFGGTNVFDGAVWQAAVTAHEQWQRRLSELAPAIVLGSRPVNKGNQRLNEGFVWEQENGYCGVHEKYYVPDEEGAWEASWYSRGRGDFTPMQTRAGCIGFAICTELWAMGQMRLYGKQGVHVIATPRLTIKATRDKWLAGGRVAAIVSGAYSLSSNRTSSTEEATDFGGQGWIIGPDGEVLGITSPEHPFMTREISLIAAEHAKRTYPRYALG
jgi:N-carbamoylputrescine amidase